MKKCVLRPKQYVLTTLRPASTLKHKLFTYAVGQMIANQLKMEFPKAVTK